jgi:hypothetical protein
VLPVRLSYFETFVEALLSFSIEMNIYAFSVGSVALLIKLYIDYNQMKDLGTTLEELKADSSLPRIREYDFIVGEHLEIVRCS